ncbi:MAG: thioredoxin [Myxococcota bacterium]
MIETQDFQRDVIDASRTTPIVVDFWAPWCGPCRMLGPVLEKLDQEANGRWRLVKVNTDVQQQVAAQFAISSIPAVKMFVDGRPIAEFVGAQPRPMIERWLQQHLPAIKDDEIEQALRAQQSGDESAARRILESKLEREPNHEVARLLLAETILRVEPDRAHVLLEGLGGERDAEDRVEAMRTLARLGAARHAPVPPGVPQATWQRYQTAIEAFFNGDYESAAEGWIAVMQKSRALDDDGARRACVAMCQWLGDGHPLTQGFRRRLASALY